MKDTNAIGAETPFTIPDVDTCLNECLRVTKCVAVDINVNADPLLCWPHYKATDLEDRNIFSYPGNNLYQLIGSCARGNYRVFLCRRSFVLPFDEWRSMSQHSPRSIFTAWACGTVSRAARPKRRRAPVADWR